MTLNDDELRDQLKRRTTSAPLEQPDRADWSSSIHVAASNAPAGVATLAAVARSTGRSRADGSRVARRHFAAAAPHTPLRLDTRRTDHPPPSTATTAPPSSSARPAVGLDVLSAEDLIALAADSSKVGQVVVSDAVISFVPSPTQFDVPDASPQAFGTIEAGGGSIVVIGQSFPDTNWPDHAFRVIDGGRVEYLGAVNSSSGNGIWTVPEAIAAAPPEAATLLFAVKAG